MPRLVRIVSHAAECTRLCFYLYTYGRMVGIYNSISKMLFRLIDFIFVFHSDVVRPHSGFETDFHSLHTCCCRCFSFSVSLFGCLDASDIYTLAIDNTDVRKEISKHVNKMDWMNEKRRKKTEHICNTPMEWFAVCACGREGRKWRVMWSRVCSDGEWWI